MLAAPPKPAAASGSVQSVWTTLAGSGPAAPVQSPVSWVMLAAARRELDTPKPVKAPAATVSTGQPVAPAATTVAVPGAAATNSAPVIGSVTLSAPNATTGAVTGTVKASDANGDKMTYKASVATSAKGKVAITTAGVFTYTPTATARHAAAKVGAATAVTTDTVTVTVTDAKGAAVTRAVAVPVSPKNSVPTATKTVGTPNATTGVVTGKVTATDADKDPLAYSVPATTAKGTVAITTAGAFTYTPTATARHAAARIGATTADKADTFTVTVTDGYGGSLAVPITVSISPRNTAPTATASIAKPDPVTGIAKGKVTATDADKDTLSYTATKPANGTVAVSTDGSFTYTPTTTARASARTSTTAKTDTFTVTVADGHGGTTAVNVTATIAPSNSAPVAGTPTASTNSTTGVVTGTINATDPDKDTLTYTATTITTAKGSAAITSAGAYTYTPTATARHTAARTSAGTAEKTDTFTATATDKYGATTAIPVSVAVAPVNAAPVAGTPTVGTPNATTGEVSGTVSATDADKDTLTYSSPSSTAKGAVAINAGTGAFTYTPTATARHAASRMGAVAADKADTFTVTAIDGYGGSVALPVAVSIAPANAAPVAGTPVVGTPNATTGVVTGTVTANDADADALTYSGSAATSKGAVVINADGSFTYTPDIAARRAATGSTTDTFSAIARDGYGGSTPLSVVVIVDPGTPVPQSPVVGVANPTSGVVSGVVTFNDTAGRSLTYTTASSSAGGGTVSINPSTGAFAYTPSRIQRQAANFTTTDTFTVTASNGARTVDQIVTVTVDPGTPLADSATVGKPDSATGLVVGNAGFTDTAGRTLTYSGSGTSTGGGTVGIDSTTGAFTYTPTPSQRLAASLPTIDSFTVTATNGLRSATRTITVEVDPGTPVALSPNVGNPSNANGVVTGTAPFADTAGRTLGYSGPSLSSGGGAVTINPASGAFTYTPSQAQRLGANLATTDSFTVTATNGIRSASETITVAVDPGTPVSGTATVGTADKTTGVVTGRAMFTDTAGRSLTYSTPSSSSGGGTVSINVGTGTFTYTPSQTQRQEANLSTADTFIVTASNGARAVSQTITVPVYPQDSKPPVAGVPAVGAPNPTSGAITGNLGFVNATGLPMTYKVTAGPSKGHLTVGDDGSFTYAPTTAGRLIAGATTGVVTDSFTVTATNGAASADQTVAVAVSPTQARLTATIPTVGYPDGLAFSPGGKYVYVALSRSGIPNPYFPFNPYSPPLGSVGVITTATNTARFYGSVYSGEVFSPGAAPLITGGSPSGVAVSPDGKYIYVTGTAGGLSVFDGTATSGTSRKDLVGDGQGVVVSPDGSRAYTSDGTVIRTASNGVYGTKLPSGGWAPAIAISPDGSRVYFVNKTAGTVTVNTTNAYTTGGTTVTTTIPVGTSPNAVALSPDGKYAYVTNSGSHTVSVITTATNTVTATIGVPAAGPTAPGPLPLAIAVSPDGSVLYITSKYGGPYSPTNGGGYSSTLSMIDTGTNTFIGTPITLAGYSAIGSGPATYPGAIAVSPDGHQVYVANGRGYDVSAFSI
jgi:YVTN family beta-propeller protein/VCBS repeat-containing protein